MSQQRELNPRSDDCVSMQSDIDKSTAKQVYHDDINSTLIELGGRGSCMNVASFCKSTLNKEDYRVELQIAAKNASCVYHKGNECIFYHANRYVRISNLIKICFQTESEGSVTRSNF